MTSWNGHARNGGQNAGAQKKERLFVKNLPFTANEELVKVAFQKFGPLTEVSFPKTSDGKMRGFGFIQFRNMTDALTAKKEMDSKILLGRRINVDFSVSKDRFVQQQKPQESMDAEHSPAIPDPTLISSKRKRQNKGQGNKKDDLFDTDDNSKVTQKSEKNMQEQKKGKVASTQKKGRLIVRNLDFRVTKESVQEAFEKFGTVSEVNIPTKPDGKRVGCVFVQFVNMTAALKARKAMNLQPFLGRPIAVDIAVSKDRYKQLKGGADTQKEPVKEETAVAVPDPSLVSKKKNKLNKGATDTEGDLVVDDDFAEVVKSDDSGDSDEDDSESEDEGAPEKDSGDDDADDGSEDASEDGSDDDSDDESQEDGSDSEAEDSDTIEPSKKKKKFSEGSESFPTKKPDRKTDVGEGKTLFIRNLSFDTTNETLRNCFIEFGELDYAIVCVDRETDHSKGSAFVKFKEKECAMSCLETAAKDEGLALDGQKIMVSIAVSREELQKRAEEKIKRAKDNRNLSLAREGLIRPGTQSATDVSKSDLELRTALDAWKRKMLTNNHMFISDTRLCVRNLPATLQEDKKLGNMFLKAGGPGAKITEARIIRDMKTVGADGIGVSKGFGYVTFTKHEHALQALRSTNNNPETFSKKSRPIVDFSIENKVALNARQKRLEKSQFKNKELIHEKKLNKKGTSAAPQQNKLQQADKDVLPYMGAKSDVQKFRGLPSHTGPKVRHVKRPQNQAPLTKSQKNKKNQRFPLPSRSVKKAALAMKPPAKKAKWSRDETKLRNIETAYHKKCEANFASSNKHQKKWFS